MLHCTVVAVCENLQLASLNFASIYFNINHNTVIYKYGMLIVAFLKCHFKFFCMLMNNNFLLTFHVSFVY